MTKKDKAVFAEGLRKISDDIAALAAYFEGTDTVPAKKQDPPAETAPAPDDDTGPAKTCTYEEARAVLAEKSRTGFRAEVKALLTAHGVKQLSEIRDPEVYAVLAQEAKEIGNG